MDDVKPMRLDAYYYGFDATGAEAIDRVLSAVACAGKAYHLTEDWSNECDPYEPFLRGETPVAWIQNAAIDAATALTAAQARIRELEADKDAAHAFISKLVHMQSGAGWTRAVVREAAANFLKAQGVATPHEPDSTPGMVARALTEAPDV